MSSEKPRTPEEVNRLNQALGIISPEDRMRLKEAIRKSQELEGIHVAIQAQFRTIGELIERNALADLSLLISLENYILEKNQLFEKLLRDNMMERYQPFESQKSECIRKVGEIMQITNLSLYLDEALLGRVPPDSKKRRTNVTFFIVIGERYWSGDLTDDDITVLMPTIADEHHLQYSKFSDMSLLYGGDLSDFLPDIHANTSEDGTKMIEEMLVMTSFLVVHGGGRYSSNWRCLQDEKLEELRPIIAAGKNTIETREAMQYLHHNYYRMRAAYERTKKRLETRPKFDRRVITNGSGY